MLALLRGSPSRRPSSPARHGVWVANDNAPGQIVLAGPRERPARGAGEIARERGRADDLRSTSRAPSTRRGWPPRGRAVPRGARRASSSARAAVTVFSGPSARPFTDVRESSRRRSCGRCAGARRWRRSRDLGARGASSTSAPTGARAARPRATCPRAQVIDLARGAQSGGQRCRLSRPCARGYRRSAPRRARAHAGIVGLGGALPERAVPNDETRRAARRRARLDRAAHRASASAATRPPASASRELARAPARAALPTPGSTPRELDLVLVATLAAGRRSRPHAAPHVAHALGAGARRGVRRRRGLQRLRRGARARRTRIDRGRARSSTRS